MSVRQPPRPPSKRDVLNSLLDEGKTMIFLDARVSGVEVPKDHTRNPNLCLNLSRAFKRPVVVSDRHVEAVLSFGGTAYPCVVPFEAIFGMYSHVTHKQFVWPEDVPPEVMEAGPGLTEGGQGASGGKAPPAKPKGKHLRAVPDLPPEDAVASAPTAGPAVASAPSAPDAVPSAEPAPATPVAQDEAVEPTPPTPTPPRRGHLKLVK
jgi:stringent starvation protein B